MVWWVTMLISIVIIQWHILTPKREGEGGERDGYDIPISMFKNNSAREKDSEFKKEKEISCRSRQECRLLWWEASLDPYWLLSQEEL